MIIWAMKSLAISSMRMRSSGDGAMLASNRIVTAALKTRACGAENHLGALDATAVTAHA